MNNLDKVVIAKIFFDNKDIENKKISKLFQIGIFNFTFVHALKKI